LCEEVNSDLGPKTIQLLQASRWRMPCDSTGTMHRSCTSSREYLGVALFHYATTSTRLDMRQRSVHICLPGLTSSAHRWLIRTVNTGYVPALWAYCYASNLGLSYNYTVRQKMLVFYFW